MSRPTDPGTHPHPFSILEEARRSKKGYNLHATREALTNAVKAAFNQNIPHDLQLDVAEALILGLDTTVVAGTGSGKTLPWAMPLLLDENKGRACLVISPLKALQADHVSRQDSSGHHRVFIHNRQSSSQHWVYLQLPSTMILGVTQK
jgi:ATP-dependent helicase YprA (DUF1998 family)